MEVSTSRNNGMYQTVSKQDMTTEFQTFGQRGVWSLNRNQIDKPIQVANCLNSSDYRGLNRNQNQNGIIEKK